MRFIVLTIAALMTFCSQAWAWGDEGHKVVCEIAYRLAQPDTRAAVRKLIRSARLATRATSIPKLGISNGPTDPTVGIRRIIPSASGGTVTSPMPLAAVASAVYGQATDR